MPITWSSSKTRETYRRSWPWRIKCIPKGRNTFLEAYTTATARPHGYLVIDMKQETWTRKYFWKSVQIGRSFIKERSQNFGSRSFENRSEPSIGRHGRTERHTSSQIQIEINWTKLTPESYGHRGTSR